MKKTDYIQCKYFQWKLFCRDGMFYADGRGNEPGIGKHSLGVKERDAALKRLHDLDQAMAIKHKFAKPDLNIAITNALPIVEGWQKFFDHASQPLSLGGVSDSTLKRYRAVRDKHIVFCQQQSIKSWNQITKKELGDYGRHLHQKGYADATLYLELNVIKAVVIFHIEQQTLPQSARLLMVVKRSEESDAYCYSREEVDAIVAHCLDTPSASWLFELILVLTTTGMRIGEACMLRWQDINFDTGCIALVDNRFSALAAKVGLVRTTKGRRGRLIPMNPACSVALRQILDRKHDDGFIFHGPNGGRATPDKVLTVFKRDVLQPLMQRFPTPQGDIGFKHGRIHSFRHYFVSECFTAGITEGEIRDWVGHRDSRIVERYRHLRYTDGAKRMLELDLVQMPTGS